MDERLILLEKKIKTNTQNRGKKNVSIFPQADSEGTLFISFSL